MKTLFIFTTTLLLFSSSFAQEKLVATGEIFDLSGKEKKFTSEKFNEIQGDKIIDRTVYKDLSGEVLVEEKLELLKDDFVRYDLNQKQLKYTAWIEAKDNKVTFNLKKPRKNNYPQTYDKPENFVVGPLIVPFIKKNWADLAANKEILVNLGVWDRQELIRFSLKKEEGPGPNLVIKMNPTSFIIRAAVSPIYFNFDPTTKNLLTYKGRTAPKEKRGRSFNDVDGISNYKHFNYGGL